MAATLKSITGLISGSDAHKRVRFGSVEPAIVAALKHLDPILAVATLLICSAAWHQHPSPALGAVAVLTFTISSYVFTRQARERELSGKPLPTVFSRILFEWTCVVAILLFVAFALKVSAVFSRSVMLCWFAGTPLCLYAAHVLRLRVHSHASNGGFAPRYVIVGANSVGFELFRRLPKKGFLGFFDFRSPDRLAATIEDPTHLVGHCRDVARYARDHGVTSIYIALPLANVPRIGEMVEALRDTTASIYFVPDVFAFDLIQGRLVEINGMPALSVCDTPFHGMDAVAKSVTDYICATLMLIVAALPMVLAAAAVKLTSRGPVLFRQRRYGLNGEEIMVYKFRSMRVCEDGAVVTQATKEDPRVTRVGRFLRKTSLDELPQLFNVLQGRMSVVGPRPHAVAHNEQYRKLITGYMIRHKVRPGMTGLAQVNGLRGETDSIEKMRERVRYDLEYLRHWSPWLDVKILLKTILVVLRSRNAY